MATPFSYFTVRGRCRLCFLPFGADVFLLRRDSNYYCFLLRAQRLPHSGLNAKAGVYHLSMMLGLVLPTSQLPIAIGHLYHFRDTGWPYHFMIQKTPKETGCLRRVALPLGKTTHQSLYLVGGCTLPRRCLKALSVTSCSRSS